MLVWDQSIGRYRELVTPARQRTREINPLGIQPGIELARAGLDPYVRSEMRALRKADATDYIRHAIWHDPKLAVELGLGGAAIFALWEVAAMIANGLAGLNPANVFTADLGGGQVLADLNPFLSALGGGGSITPSGGGGSGSSSAPPPVPLPIPAPDLFPVFV